SGRPLLDLSRTNPTEVGLQHPPSLLAHLGDPRATSHAPHPFGLPEARHTVARHYRSLGCDVEPERVVLCASTSEAYAHLFALCCDPKDAVAVPRPGYPLLEHIADICGVERVSYRFEHVDRAWRLDLDSLDHAVRGAGARAVVAVAPNN